MPTDRPGERGGDVSSSLFIEEAMKVGRQGRRLFAEALVRIAWIRSLVEYSNGQLNSVDLEPTLPKKQLLVICGDNCTQPMRLGLVCVSTHNRHEESPRKRQDIMYRISSIGRKVAPAFIRSRLSKISYPSRQGIFLFAKWPQIILLSKANAPEERATTMLIPSYPFIHQYRHPTSQVLDPMTSHQGSDD